MTVTPTDILAFWFSKESKRWWFKKSPDFDAELQRRFGEAYQAASAGQLDAWGQSAEGALALVILLDQLPRNLFRHTQNAYQHDAMAKIVAKAAIAKGYDAALPAEQRAFLYMPLMHSEELADQEQSVALFTAAGLEKNIPHAVEHRDIIARFGRFPHRNEALGRASTPEEIAYLGSPQAFRG